MRSFRFLLTALLSVLASTAVAQSRNVIVFTAQLDHVDLDPADAALLQRAIESDLGPALTPLGYSVLTEENAKELLKGKNIDAAALQRSDSYLAAARAAKLSLFVTTQISAADGQLNAEIRMFDATSGNMISSEGLDGQDGASLRKSWKHSRDRFIGLAKQNLAKAAPAAASDNSAVELKALKAGCERSEPSKCLKLGEVYEKGQGVTADATAAIDYYGRACSGGYPEGCSALRALQNH